MIPPVKSRTRRKPRTIREIAQHAAWMARKREAKRLNCALSEAMDRKAEEVWARFADPDYYEKEFATSAFRRRVEWPSNNHFKRERIHEGGAV